MRRSRLELYLLNNIKLSSTSKSSSSVLIANPPKQELSAIHLGRLRVEIKKHLATEMREIDKLVKKLIA